MTPHGESTSILKLERGVDFRQSVPFAKARSSAQFRTLPTSLNSVPLSLSQPPFGLREKSDFCYWQVLPISNTMERRDFVYAFLGSTNERASG
jgi:hypothetical protein